MKYIDKFLKKLNTDRNTFATYILTLITVYLAVDRIVEMLLMIFTGVSYSYWGPITYTLALACPIFAFLFSGSSKFATSKAQKVTLFYVFLIGLYIIALSMFTQWLNMGAWLLLFSVPNYAELISEFSYLVTPAFCSLSLYLPLASFFPFFYWVYFDINDTKDEIRSIWDYKGISLADKKQGHGPYTCDIYVCHDSETGKSITFDEAFRYHSLFVCGGSGSGKTSLVYEPLIARDLERKFFFREVSKEMGFTALKTRIATLNAPYDNEYLNKNFSLNMIKPAYGKDTIFKSYLKKMILEASSDEIIYRDLGLTLMSPDIEVIKHMSDVCKNFGLSYKVIDPSNPNSIGLNPFVYDDPNKIAITISSALKAMYNSTHNNTEEAYREDITIQAIENLAIILKEMYPRMHEGTLPNLDDMLKMLTNFDLIEKMCEILAHDEELNEQYSVQLTYFRKNFYKNAPGKETIEKYLYTAVSQLDNLLRLSGVRNILCNRHQNLDFDKSLKNGEIIFVCTRRGDLGASSHKAFGLFFLISMQNAVLRRPGNEKSRIPNFLYIDEFPDFICKDTEAIFTMYRKYKIATTISAQSISQLNVDGQKENYRNTILANCASKIFTGGAPYEELEWWSKEFGTKRDWKYKVDMDMEKMKYTPKYSGVEWGWTQYFKPEKLQTLPAKGIAYKIKTSGKPSVGPATLSYLASKYKEPQKIKNFDFRKFNDSATTTDEDDTSKKKFDLKNLSFVDERNEIDPVQTDTTDSKYLFDNEDAIIVNLKKGNPNNE